MKSKSAVFVDTNVWFSAFYGSVVCEKIVKAHILGKIEVIISELVLKEIVRNVQKKIPRASKSLKTFLEAAPPSIIKDPKNVSKKVQDLASKGDWRILEAAKVGKARILVTGNLKHFKVKEIEVRLGMEVISPREAVTKLKL